MSTAQGTEPAGGLLPRLPRHFQHRVVDDGRVGAGCLPHCLRNLEHEPQPGVYIVPCPSGRVEEKQLKNF